MVSCVCCIRTGATEHHRRDSAAVQCLLQTAAHRQCDVSSCGPLGPLCGMSPECGRKWGMPGRALGVAGGGHAGTSPGCGRKWGMPGRALGVAGGGACRDEPWVWPEVGMPGRALGVAGVGHAGTSPGCGRK